MVVNSFNDDCLWTLSQGGLSYAFHSVVRASLAHVEDPRLMDVFPRQTKKLAISYCWKYFSSHVVKDKPPAWTGNSSVKVWKGSHLGSVPDIQLPCVVPLGMIFPSS